MDLTKIELNAFRIKDNFLPEKVFKYSLSFFEDDKEEKIKTIKKIYNAISLSSLEETEIEVASWENPSDKGIKNFELVPLRDIPLNKQEELVTAFLRYKVKIQDRLRKAIPIPHKSLGSVIAIPDVKKFSVKKISGDFFLFLDIGYHVRLKHSVYALVQQGEISYEELVGKVVYYDPYKEKVGNRQKVKITKVEYDDELLKKVSAYLKEKYGKNDLPLNAPLLYIQFISNKNEEYKTHPCCCYFESKKYIKKLTICNEKRKNILMNIAKKLPFLDENPLSEAKPSFSPPKYLVKDAGKLFKVGKLTDCIKHSPFFVPKEIRELKRIPVFVLVDESLPEKEVKEILYFQIRKGYLKLKKEGLEVNFETIKNSDKLFFTVNPKAFVLPEKVKDILQDKEIAISVALFVCRELPLETYENVKRLLFAENIISQFVTLDKWKKSPNYVSQVIALNLYSKLGIRPFALAEKLDYDFIIGVDVGNDKFNRRTKAGSIAVSLSNGIIKTLIPVQFDVGGEKTLLKELIEIALLKLKILNKRQSKRLLILKDGNLYKEEVTGLANSHLIKGHPIEIHVLNVKKNHSVRILSDVGEKGICFNNEWGVLLPHSVDGGRSLLIDQAYSIKGGEVEKLPVTHSLLSCLYKLSKVNLSTIFGEERMLRLPAPLHYADKFVKSLSRNWPVSNWLLEIGSLYFL